MRSAGITAGALGATLGAAVAGLATPALAQEAAQQAAEEPASIDAAIAGVAKLCLQGETGRGHRRQARWAGYRQSGGDFRPPAQYGGQSLGRAFRGFSPLLPGLARATVCF